MKDVTPLTPEDAALLNRGKALIGYATPKELKKWDGEMAYREKFGKARVDESPELEAVIFAIKHHEAEAIG